MLDGRYLLRVAEMDATGEQIRRKLDDERLKKLEAAHLLERKRACAGAGLLIQWALQQRAAEEGRTESLRESGIWTKQKGLCRKNLRSTGRSETGFAPKMQELSLEELLAGLGEPIPLSYTYGAKGKPFFRDIPLFFNLSHSGDYVACVLSEHEIGVDIQKQKPLNGERISNRFFHEREKELLMGFSDEAERLSWFYRLWTRKEAYGKMTGEGIGDAAAKDFSTLDAEWMQGFVWEEYDFPAGYKMACCFRV